jgi:hypothetical protein
VLLFTQVLVAGYTMLWFSVGNLGCGMLRLQLLQFQQLLLPPMDYHLCMNGNNLVPRLFPLFEERPWLGLVTCHADFAW